MRASDCGLDEVLLFRSVHDFGILLFFGGKAGMTGFFLLRIAKGFCSKE